MEDRKSTETLITSKFAMEFEDEEEEMDTLSFCNLPTGENNTDSIPQSPRNSFHQIDHNFQFFTPSQPKPKLKPEIIFCGRIIHEEEAEELNEYQKRDYFSTIKSYSFRESNQVKHQRSMSSSTRFSGNLILQPNSSTRGQSSYHGHSVNITALTSMSTKSKRRMFMFGPVKFKPEMELTAIKQRQGCRSDQAGLSGEKNRPGLLGRSHLAGVLARSFGCIPMATGVVN